MNLAPYIDYLYQWFNYSSQCSGLPLKTAGCRQFWMASLFATEFVVVLLFTFIIYRSWRKMRAWKSYQQWLLDRDRIDPDIESKKWKGDNAFDDIGQADLAQLLRESIAKSKSA